MYTFSPALPPLITILAGHGEIVQMYSMEISFRGSLWQSGKDRYSIPSANDRSPWEPRSVLPNTCCCEIAYTLQLSEGIQTLSNLSTTSPSLTIVGLWLMGIQASAGQSAVVHRAIPFLRRSFCYTNRRSSGVSDPRAGLCFACGGASTPFDRQGLFSKVPTFPCLDCSGSGQKYLQGV